MTISISSLFLLMAGAVLVSSMAYRTPSDYVEPRQSNGAFRVGLEDLITQLPGLDYSPGFRQYSGYLTVSKEHGRNIFYWYLESQGNPKTDPVVLWTNGGPGCSGLIGLLEEHGPYIIDEKMQLSPNPYSWNKVANMLYIEQPAGTGFSYYTKPRDRKTSDTKAVKDNYQLILAFMERFPERRFNDFYIASESYGGHYMPQLALEILRHNRNGLVKFKGMMVGNPYVDFFLGFQYRINTLFYHGLIPEYLRKDWFNRCNTPYKLNNVACVELYLAIMNTPGEGINLYALDFPICTEKQTTMSTDAATHHRRTMLSSISSPQARQLMRQLLQQNVSRASGKASSTATTNNNNDHHQACSSLYANTYLNRQDVRTALHVDEQWSTKNWTDCTNGNTEVLEYSFMDTATPVIDLYQELVTMGKAGRHHLNMLVYSGDNDVICSTAHTQQWIWNLNVSGQVNQTWISWIVDEQTAGFLTKFDLGVHHSHHHATNRSSTFTFVTVHGAGHQVPTYRPKEAFVMFQKYLSGEW